MSVETLTGSDTDTEATVSDLDHFVCCNDENIALCGVDASEIPWGHFGDPCETCVRLMRADDEWIEEHGDGSDPCPHCPRNVLGGAS